ncbi:FlgB family protein [Pseudooceanicola sp. C21-150M6]
MFQDLQIFQTAGRLAQHSAARQAIIAENIANADTPGYKARDISPFSDDDANYSADHSMRQTRSGHLDSIGSLRLFTDKLYESADVNPNGNSVSLEEQMVMAIDVKRRHDRALAIYRSGLNILHSSLGRR